MKTKPLTTKPEAPAELSCTDLLASDNLTYIITFLANSGEKVRAIRLVMDAAGLDSKAAEKHVNTAWREWRKKHPLIAG